MKIMYQVYRQISIKVIRFVTAKKQEALRATDFNWVDSVLSMGNLICFLLNSFFLFCIIWNLEFFLYLCIECYKVWWQRQCSVFLFSVLRFGRLGIPSGDTAALCKDMKDFAFQYVDYENMAKQLMPESNHVQHWSKIIETRWGTHVCHGNVV